MKLQQKLCHIILYSHDLIQNTELCYHVLNLQFLFLFETFCCIFLCGCYFMIDF